MAEGTKAGVGMKSVPRPVPLMVTEKWRRALGAAGLSTMEDLFAIGRETALTKANLPGWRERIRLEVRGVGAVFLKRYTRPPLLQQMRRVLSGHILQSSAGVEWDCMRQLQEGGIVAVRGIAFAEERTGPWERRSAVLAERVPGESLEQIANRQQQRAPRAFVEQFAGFVAGFHGAGFVHRDLYLCHIFTDTSRDPAELSLIDVARVFKPVWRKARWVVKDLASLNYSTPRHSATVSDRLRFLRTYLGVGKFGPGHRRLIRRIVVKTLRIARHDQRRAAGRGPEA